VLGNFSCPTFRADALRCWEAEASMKCRVAAPGMKVKGPIMKAAGAYLLNIHVVQLLYWVLQVS
jgi:hypothetical protein